MVKGRLTYLAALAILAGAPTAARAESVGAVVASRGEAALERAGGREAATAGAAVMLDDRATTGEESRLDLKLGAGTRLRLGANAALKIDKFVAKVAAETELQQGAVLVDRGKGAEKSFEMKTPYGLLAARGTVFFAGPSQGRFGVFVQKGAVDVKTDRGSVRVGAGEGVDFPLIDGAPEVAVGAPPPAPGGRGEALSAAAPPAPLTVKKWGAPRIRAALDSVQ